MNPHSHNASPEQRNTNRANGRVGPAGVFRRAVSGLLWLTLFVASALGQSTNTLPNFSAQERELKASETHSYRLPLTAGQFFYALVEQKEIDLSIVLFGPDGQQIAETDSPNDRWGTEPVLLLAGKSGDYLAAVNHTHLLGVRLHDRLAHGHLAVAAYGDFALAPNGENGGGPHARERIGIRRVVHAGVHAGR